MEDNHTIKMAENEMHRKIFIPKYNEINEHFFTL
jgi:hypothetical protein